MFSCSVQVLKLAVCKSALATSCYKCIPPVSLQICGFHSAGRGYEPSFKIHGPNLRQCKKHKNPLYRKERAAKVSWFNFFFLTHKRLKLYIMAPVISWSFSWNVISGSYMIAIVLEVNILEYRSWLGDTPSVDILHYKKWMLVLSCSNMYIKLFMVEIIWSWMYLTLLASRLHNLPAKPE